MDELPLHINNHNSFIRIGSGLFDQLDAYQNRKIIFLVDENVYRLHRKKFKERECIVIPSGEQHKSPAFATELYRELLRLQADRDAFIIGVGGGLVTDLAGFVASTYMRGIEFGFISTTLLGQVDASIGGKNGLNLDGYKNMIGVIRQPEFVLCDLDFLDTLDQNELVSGFSEVIKYGAIRDRQLFEFLENNYSDIMKRDRDALVHIIKRSCAIKIDVVQSDVQEEGERKLLNFGHTIGHAIEKISGMLHGHAIAAGMTLAARLSVKLGFMQIEESTRLLHLIELSGLPVKTDLRPETVYHALLKDKKRSGDHINFILLQRIGAAFIHKIQNEELKSAIHDLY
ncbi:MAG: 3-dehydroquinate synthase [Bacteroidales bacterium]|nr:3-dehydroquinate synthase [Bacteroidales bacterium]